MSTPSRIMMADEMPEPEVLHFAAFPTNSVTLVLVGSIEPTIEHARELADLNPALGCIIVHPAQQRWSSREAFFEWVAQQPDGSCLGWFGPLYANGCNPVPGGYRP